MKRIYNFAIVRLLILLVIAISALAINNLADINYTSAPPNKTNGQYSDFYIQQLP